ncbi:50S ribosomal protein L3 [bacterium]|nr:50S ribosomal protein L3 [bacterium]
MLKKIPAKKIGMTSAFDGAGTTLPVTLVQPMKVVVTEIRRPEKHGYAAVQLAYEETLPKRINKPHKGVLNKAGVKESYRRFFEARVSPDELEQFTLGQEISPDEMLATWNEVTVSGVSKGKGFAGAVKRWGFKGQCRSHGDPDNRRPMSNNATDPARVFKGSRRPGRMGNKRVSVKGLGVFEYDPALNLLVLDGSVPGPNGGTVFVTMVGEREAPVQEPEGEPGGE